MNDAGDIGHVASAIFFVSICYPSAGDMPATSGAEKALHLEHKKSQEYYFYAINTCRIISKIYIMA